MTKRRIRAEHLRGHPGLMETTMVSIIARQPKTVLDAIQIPGVGRKAARRLLALGLITDPENAMNLSASKASRVRSPDATAHDAAVHGFDERPEVAELLASVRVALPVLEELLDRCTGEWGYEDPIYRLYHQSWKVFRVQDLTLEIVVALQALAPERPLNRDFMSIIGGGTERVFKNEDNARWLEATRPIIEAFLHARFFLEMAVAYGQTFIVAPTMLPGGWAAFLYLYDLR